MGVHREVESGGSRRQNAGLTNRKRTEAAQRAVREGEGANEEGYIANGACCGCVVARWGQQAFSRAFLIIGWSEYCSAMR